MLLCESGGSGPNEFEDLAVFVSQLSALGVEARIDVRSVSRVGRSDVGTNARRIGDFLDALQD